MLLVTDDHVFVVKEHAAVEDGGADHLHEYSGGVQETAQKKRKCRNCKISVKYAISDFG